MVRAGMKKLLLIFIFILPSVFVIAQESAVGETSTDTDSTLTGSDKTQTGSDNASTGAHKYFISTNSGLLNTPVGFRIGILDRMGGYIGIRFGKGYKYEEDVYNPLKATEATLFAANAGLIFPISIQNTFKVHTFLGIGYGKWFDRPSQNGQTMGVEFEGGLMLSYQKFMLNLGGNVLMGDGNSPKGDMTVGIGFRF
jgi:hypothetical protein